jgi:hypothetical protein
LLRSLAQPRIEPADAEQSEDGFDPVDDPCLLANQVLPLAARPTRVFAMVGIATMLQWRFSPRSQPRNERISSSVSIRSLLARRCSRDTAMLAAWMT